MKQPGRKERIGARARESAALLIISTVLLILGAVALINLETPPVVPDTNARISGGEPSQVIPTSARLEPATPQPAEPGTAPDVALLSSSIEADVAALKMKGLLLPVAGVTASQLRDSFGDARSEGRQHQAIDIKAQPGAPVVAVADGAVMKLWQSARGGITLYHSDSTGQYIYYYAHLMRYADGIVEGKPVKRGEVIAFVGDTGNAGAGNYHLHFAIHKPIASGRWSGGVPINPYFVFAGK